MGREAAAGSLPHVRLRDARTARFERFVARHRGSRRLVLFTRAAANGQVRHFIQVPAGKVAQFHAAFGLRQGVVGLFSVRHRDADHIYLRLGDQVHHLSYHSNRGQAYWTMNDGGTRQRFRESSSMRTERLLQLDGDEFRRLKAHVAALMRSARAHGRLPGFEGNCVNVWMSAEIGRGNMSLSRLIGIREEDFGPDVMKQALETGNEKVLGVAVYPPRGREFRCFERTRDPF